jgi:hypothetical protein
MPPILKRLRKLSDPAKSPDLATLLEPYGNNEGEGSANPSAGSGPAAPAGESAAPDGES